MIDRLLTDLSQPGAWPRPGPVEVRQTHISAVFLVGDRAYKIKKPLDLGFLDFTTLERRRHFCEEEVRLNGRFSPGVYLGVVPIGERGGTLVPGAEPAVEWAVEMVRLSDDDTLLAHLEAGTADRATVEAVGHAIAAMHAALDPGDPVHASLATVARNARDNFDQTRAHVGATVHAGVWQRLRALTELALDRLGPAIEARALRALDTHGDLRLEHIYLLDRGIRCIDCIEFNEAFRHADPVADVAFAVMDLAVRGERVLADALADAWFGQAGDGGRELLPFYVAYRSVVRAKVAGLQHREPEVPDERRELALFRGRRHWLFALDTLETPALRPCLVGVGGLPGTGKSTLAKRLAAEAGFEVIRADVVRKELAGIALHDHPEHGYEQGLYTPQNKDRVYRVCLERAREVVLGGGRAIVDASWSKRRWRPWLLDEARSLGVRARFLWCEAPPEVVRLRLDNRGPDPSDADWSVYERAARSWEPDTDELSDIVDAGGSVDDAVATARRALAGAGLDG